MQLDRDLCYRAVRSRDARFDGRFFTAVRTTGVYCRPICPAPIPHKDNVEFYACAAAAEAAGYRPCRRCRPEVAPSTPAWSGTSTTVGRALSLIEDGALDLAGLESLSSRLGIGARHLRRLFVKHLGVAPQVIAASRRAHLARLLLDQTPLPVSQVALAAGFRSLRRFNDAIKTTFGAPPTQLRGRAPASAAIEVRLTYRPPLDWNALTTFQSRRAIDGIESFSAGAYDRGAIHVVHDASRRSLILSLPTELVPQIRKLVTRARHLFDADADPEPIASHLMSDRLLRPILRRHAGIRVPGAWDPFEVAVRAIVGQQVSVAGATTTMRKLIGDSRSFPAAAELATAHIGGMPKQRAETIRRLAAAVAEGDPVLERAASLEESIARLTSIKGIGPWTAHYIAMRVLREPDAFPAGDLVLQKAAGARSEAELRRMAERWRPWRAYAAMLLWNRA
jgi:AraC family transcriptional regulator of adaptative response / DNA-3-methyladenine glycosylase II